MSQSTQLLQVPVDQVPGMISVIKSDTKFTQFVRS